MLSLFPTLLDFSLIGIFLLRTVTGLFYMMFGLYLIQATQTFQRKSAKTLLFGYGYGIFKCSVGAFLTLGIFTQPAAITGMFITSATYMHTHSSRAQKSVQQVQILLFFSCLSLLFLGAGAFAFDIPL